MSNAANQARRLYEVFSALVRAYQFRDRDQVACHGLSVSQCYALEWLANQGPATMGVLARRMHLDLSTMTRVVDHLVQARLAERLADPHDRRICRVQITRRGQQHVDRIRADLVAEHKQVLAHVAPESREAVIEAVSRLLDAFLQRQAGMSGAGASEAGPRGVDPSGAAPAPAGQPDCSTRPGRRPSRPRKEPAG
jgi:DNA-binding MarR family transcriptional regulator